jgi:hypothetical protein
MKPQQRREKCRHYIPVFYGWGGIKRLYGNEGLPLAALAASRLFSDIYFFANSF